MTNIELFNLEWREDGTCAWMEGRRDGGMEGLRNGFG